MDEFDKTLYVYTSAYRLRAYKLGQTESQQHSENLA